MKRFAFYGRVSTEDQQDPASSRNWQLARSRQVIDPHGEIVEEFFDIGQSRSLPWKRRPEAARLLDAFRDPNRGFDAVVIGEPQRAFYGNQFGLTFPVFMHYGVELWVPEVGGAVDPGSEAHDLVMSLYGGMSKGERMRIKTRVRAAMASSGRRSRAGSSADARPTATSSSTPARTPTRRRPRSASGSTAWRPIRSPRPSSQRIFAEYVAGQRAPRDRRWPHRRRHPVPVGARPRAEPSPASGQGSGPSPPSGRSSTTRATPGYEVWNKQRKDEVLLDVDDVALGHVTRDALERLDRLGDLSGADPRAARQPGDRSTQPKRCSTRAKRTSTRERPTQSATSTRSPVDALRCLRPAHAGPVEPRPGLLPLQVRRGAIPTPATAHPRNIYVKEDRSLLPGLDRWLATLFDDDHIDDTCERLAGVGARPGVRRAARPR